MSKVEGRRGSRSRLPTFDCSTLRLSTRSLLAPVALGLVACAHVEPPPGGPPDAEPPFIVSVTPDSGAVVPGFDGDALIRFNEVIEEGGVGGRDGLAGAVLLSPVAGEVKVSWKRTALAVRPDRGWQRDRVYHLQVLSGVRDLRGNVMEQGRLIVFSTGPSIVATSLEGVAIDWERGTLLRQALIDARPAGDTTGYRTIADSAGRFSLTYLPPGSYVVYAVQDQNRNRRLDPREAFDTAVVTLDSVAQVELWTLPRDTVPPRLRAAQAADSMAARLEFTHPLDPYQPLDSLEARVRLLPDSSAVAVAGLWRPAVYDSIVAARAAAARDSAAAADTVAAADTAAARDTTARDTVLRRGRPAGPPARTPQDTAAQRLLAQRPPLSDRLVLEVVEPLRRGTRYLIELFGVRSAAGVTADTASNVLSVPERREEPPVRLPGRDTIPPDRQ